MRERAATVATVALGAVGWTALEYGLHRFAMHQLRGRGLASVEHLKHHADVTYFSPASKKAASALATTAIVLPLATAVAGRRRAVELTTGLIGTYYAYEVAHRRTHTHPPRGRYSRWTRRNHMHHHFGAPMRCFGVTTSVWDRVFGTYDDPGVVSVPRRMAPAWLLDESGAVHAELAGDYVVKAGPVRDSAQAARDHDDAFANVAPEL
jgi:sterol desaturase/sphingolipid hydroxylase (fatty acid hydroxylase superfamily)